MNKVILNSKPGSYITNQLRDINIINSNKFLLEINDIIDNEMIDIDFTNKPEENKINIKQNFQKFKDQKYLIEDLMVYLKPNLSYCPLFWGVPMFMLSYTQDI